MRWVSDQTGRFQWRPYYTAVEIDRLCERRVRSFLRMRYGAVSYPLATDDLTRLIEQEVGDLDLFADLEGCDGESAEVQGVTTFVRGERPRVQIARTLSEQPARQARLRTTLAHELGHVLLHRKLLDQNDGDDWPPAEAPDPWPSSCMTEPGRRVPRADWMEWQAGYASGAILMPRMAIALALALRPVLRRPARGRSLAGSSAGRMIDIVQGQFLVSAAAAFVRLRQLGYLQGRAPP